MGSVLDTVPDVSVCDYDDPSRLHLAGVTISSLSVRLAVCVHDIPVGPFCKFLQKETWGQGPRHTQEEGCVKHKVHAIVYAELNDRSCSELWYQTYRLQSE